MVKLGRFGAGAALVVGFWLAGTAAQAAPQILGLVASNALPTPLACRDGYCSAYLASFCLQQAREAPNSGNEYHLAPGGGLTLIITLADGRQIHRPAGGLVSLRMRSGFTAVGASLPAAALDGLDIRAVALEIASGTTILPDALAGDPEPQSAEEIARATGALRRLAAETFEGRSETADASRLLGLVINAVPEDRSSKHARLDRIWIQTTTAGAGKVGQAGLALAGRIVEGCRERTVSATNYAIAFCLASKQAELLTTMNRQFWDSAGGS
jgi:hypothetical protein